MSDDDLPVRAGLVIPADELTVTASRSGGPGGQHVNRTATRITLRWSVERSRVLGDAARARLKQRLSARLTAAGELVVHAEEFRSQTANRRAARERLADIVRAALRVPKPRRRTRPTQASRQRRLEGKSRRSQVKRRRRPPSRDDTH